MKASFNYRIQFSFFAVLSLMVISCNKAQVPLRGEYKSNECTFLIREKAGTLKYNFSTAKAAFSLNFNENNSVDVNIAAQPTIKAEVKANKGNTAKNGIAYIISCGKIMVADTGGSSKEIKLELWVKSKPSADTLQVELRQMEFMDAFPMGEITLFKP